MNSCIDQQKEKKSKESSKSKKKKDKEDNKNDDSDSSSDSEGPVKLSEFFKNFSWSLSLTHVPEKIQR